MSTNTENFGLYPIAWILLLVLKTKEITKLHVWFKHDFVIWIEQIDCTNDNAFCKKKLVNI